MQGDTKERYGTVSRLFHWGMAFFIAWQLLKLTDRINDGEHWVGYNLVTWHFSIGTLLLVLVALRIIWALSQRRKRPEQDPAMAALVKTGHVLLYAVMVLMPISGASRMVGKGYGWEAFGIQLVAKGEEIPWLMAIGSVHPPLAWLFILMIIGHIGLALFHRFVKRDDVLKRML